MDKRVVVDIEPGRVAGPGAVVLAGMATWLADARDAAIAVEVIRNRMADRWPLFTAQLQRLVHDGWQVARPAPDGVPTPVGLSTVLDVGWFDNILLTR